MSSSTKIDVNYLSLGGNGQWTLNSGGPNPLVGVGFPTDGKLTPPNPTSYASILKLADGATIDLKDISVAQGAECAVDVNNHANVRLSGTFGNPIDGTGNQIFSVKGSSKCVISGILNGSGNRLNADILVDNWSDQSYGGSTVDLTLALHVTGRKIRVVKRFGASNVIGNYELLTGASIKLTVYWWAKWIIRKVLRIPVGTKGPSWF